MTEPCQSIAQHGRMICLICLLLIAPDSAWSQECLSGERTFEEGESDESWWEGRIVKRNFAIIECTEKIGSASLTERKFVEIPRDRGGEYIKAGKYDVYISKPEGDLKSDAVFLRIDSFIRKSAHGFVLNISPLVRTPEHQSGAIMFFEASDGTGWKIDIDYKRLIDVNNHAEISVVIEDLINLAQIGDRNGKQ
jgi:hypothetical protein